MICVRPMFDAPKLKKLFPETADYELIALFPIGYKEKDAEPLSSSL